MFSCVQTKAAEEPPSVTNTAMSNVFVSDRKPSRTNGGSGSGSTLRDGFLYSFCYLYL